MRKAIAQPGVKSVAIAWPLLVLAHFALFTYIAPFIREAGLPDYAISLSLTVLGVSGLLGIWIAGHHRGLPAPPFAAHHDGGNRRRDAALAVVGGSIPVAMVLMAVWGAGLGAIGIYNQSAILRAGREYKDAANGLTVLTIQLGITIGALYGSAALVVAGPLLVPGRRGRAGHRRPGHRLAGKTAAYPPGRKEGGSSEPEVREPALQHSDVPDPSAPSEGSAGR